MNFVLDASIALSWCFSDEATQETTLLLERLSQESAFVPELWTLEVGNILISAERRQRITYAKITEFITLLQQINIKIDNETSMRGFREILPLAHSENLTTYDAAYLELAMRLGLPLATKDKQLAKAAKKIGVLLLLDA
ncbi:MAG: type II toxin-antitoxin system VapC family toxin [Gammaproteobacteria bacterium]|nr:type II toxin-antitoxin system VapC family toxin [Gammaproteobacteria bacterium]